VETVVDIPTRRLSRLPKRNEPNERVQFVRLKVGVFEEVMGGYSEDSK
jgi:hypothetical protein